MCIFLLFYFILTVCIQHLHVFGMHTLLREWRQRHSGSVQSPTDGILIASYKREGSRNAWLPWALEGPLTKEFGSNMSLHVNLLKRHLGFLKSVQNKCNISLQLKLVSAVLEKKEYRENSRFICININQQFTWRSCFPEFPYSSF